MRRIVSSVSRGARSVFSLNRGWEFARLVKLLDLRKPDRLLDVGCGDGYWTRRFRAHADRVVALDLSPKLLGDAVTHHQLAGIDYVLGSAQDLPYADGTFDRVTAVSVVEHFRDPVKAIHELARVLKPGGVLAITVDALSDENSTAEFRDWHRAKHFVTTYFSVEGLASALRDAGLDVDAASAEGVFTTRLAGRLRATFIRHPRTLLPLFPAFYLGTRAADALAIGGRVAPQIFAIRATKRAAAEPTTEAAARVPIRS